MTPAAQAAPRGPLYMPRPILLQVIQLFDSWAHHLSPSQFAEFSLPYAERIIRAVRERHPTTPIIFHANGGTGKLELIRSCTANVIGIDWATEMSEARRIFGPDVTLQGNVDPMVLFGPEEVGSKQGRKARTVDALSPMV